MKVPTYTAQSDVTNRTGQTPLRVQANVGAATQAISAQADLFQQAQRTSMTFLEQETKLQRATELAALENSFAARLQEHSLAAMDNRNPTSMMTNWNESVKRSLNDLGRDIDDPVVRRRFIASASNDILTGRLNIMKQARANRIDQSLATHLEKVNTLKKLAYNGNSLERMKALRELYGSPEIDTGDAAFKSPAVTGVFQRMENLGLISAAKRVELENDTRLEVESGEIYQDLSAAAVSGNPDHADQIVDNLANPDQYPNITGSARNTLINKAISLRDSLTDDEISRKKKVLDYNKAQRTLKQTENYADFTLRLSQENDNPNFEGEPVTLNELQEALDDNELTVAQYEALKSTRLETGLTRSDASTLFDLNTKIDLADSKEDLDDIREDLSTFMANKQLTASDATQLLNRMKTQLSNTPKSISIKRERRNLLRTLGVDVNGRFDDPNLVVSQKLAVTDAIRSFDDLVNVHNVNPREAADYIGSNFVNQEAFGADFENIGILAPNQFIYNEIMELPEGPMSNDDYKEIKKKINRSGLSPKMEVYELETLDLIKKFKSSQEAAPLPSTTENKPSFLERIFGS